MSQVIWKNSSKRVNIVLFIYLGFYKGILHISQASVVHSSHKNQSHFPLEKGTGCVVQEEISPNLKKISYFCLKCCSRTAKCVNGCGTSDYSPPATRLWNEQLGKLHVYCGYTPASLSNKQFFFFPSWIWAQSVSFSKRKFAAPYVTCFSWPLKLIVADTKASITLEITGPVRSSEMCLLSVPRPELNNVRQHLVFFMLLTSGINWGTENLLAPLSQQLKPRELLCKPQIRSQ